MNCALKYPGSKWKTAEWITSFFPPHKFYVEPFFGSGAVYFTKEPAIYETINDIDGLVVNFFKACRDYPEELARAVCLTPFSRQEYLEIQEKKAGEPLQLTGDCVEDARRFLVRCSQGFGSKLSDRAGWKNTKASNGPVNPKIWNEYPKIILSYAERLKNAQIECTDAVQLIRDCNHSDCLIYADPPYLKECRPKRCYRFEMQEEEQHNGLLDALLNHNGMVILSGYDNQLYNDRLKGWHKETKSAVVNSGRNATECIWMNFSHQLGF